MRSRWACCSLMRWHLHGKVFSEIHIVFWERLQEKGVEVEILHFRCSRLWHKLLIRVIHQCLQFGPQNSAN